MEDNLSNKLESMVKSAMQTNLSGNENWPFKSIEDYRNRSGKRFRITKEQRDSGISREDAFKQFMESLITKS